MKKIYESPRMRLDCEHVECTEYGDYCSLLSDSCKCLSQKNVEQCKREADIFRIGYERGLEGAHEAIKFKEYFDTLYGQGLEIANWHMNGETEPFDNFYESALEE